MAPSILSVSIRFLEVGAAALSLALVVACASPSTEMGSEASSEAGSEPLFENDFEGSFAAIEATSLLGEPLSRPDMAVEAREKQQELLELARAELAEAPDSSDHQIWVGRRLAYLGRYRDAIAQYSEAIDQSPTDARLYRHRGHRYLTIRELDKAERDLARAAELTAGMPDQVEPDGLPNAAGVPTSTLQTNIYYHLGLARYLTADWGGAIEAYRKCLDLSENPDMLIATQYWLYMSLRRAERHAEAKELAANIPSELELLESGDYHRLLLLFRGDLSEDELLDGAEVDGSLSSATVGYGVGINRLLNGNEESALEMFRQVTSAEGWAPFGYIAAEAELARRAVGEEL